MVARKCEEVALPRDTATNPVRDLGRISGKGSLRGLACILQRLTSFMSIQNPNSNPNPNLRQAEAPQAGEMQTVSWAESCAPI